MEPKMTFEDYLKQDERYIRAESRLNKAREAISRHSGRWGEARRFAGRSAVVRLDKLDRARASWNKAWVSAERRYKKMFP